MAGYGIEQNFSKPVIGTDTQAVGATKLDVILDSIDATLSAKVTPSGMDINAALSLRSGSTYSALTDASKLGLRPATALAAGTHPAALYANTAGELCYNDNVGNAVTLTSAGAVAGATGNIGTTGAPAYATSSVELQWDAAAGYYFRGSAGVAATVLVGATKFRNSTYAVNMIAPTLTTDYTLTLPPAVPATANTLLTMSIAGVVTNTGAPSVATLAVSGAATLPSITGPSALTGTLSVSGLITATAGLTAAANQSITISGTGAYKHGAKQLVIAGNAFQPTEEVGLVDFSKPDNRLIAYDPSAWVYAVALPEGTRVNQINWRYQRFSGTVTFSAIQRSSNGTLIASESDAVSTGTTEDVALTTTDFTIDSDSMLYLVMDTTSTVETRLVSISINYSVP